MAAKKKKTGSEFNISGWKFKKFHRPDFRNAINGTNYYLSGGFSECLYGLKFLTGGHLYLHQLKAMRDAVKKYIKGKADLRVHFNSKLLLRKKKTGMRMGKGKGPVLWWVYNVKPGSILMEVSDFPLVSKIFKIVSKKCPLKLKVVKMFI
jgi:large subunit ribosomal protein L16